MTGSALPVVQFPTIKQLVDIQKVTSLTLYDYVKNDANFLTALDAACAGMVPPVVLLIDPERAAIIAEKQKFMAACIALGLVEAELQAKANNDDVLQAINDAINDALEEEKRTFSKVAKKRAIETMKQFAVASKLDISALPQEEVAEAKVGNDPIPPMNPAKIKVQEVIRAFDKNIKKYDTKNKYIAEANDVGGVAVYDSSSKGKNEIATISAAGKIASSNIGEADYVGRAKVVASLAISSNKPFDQPLNGTATPEKFRKILIEVLTKAGYTQLDIVEKKSISKETKPQNHQSLKN